jgi:hypothetical protein
MSTNTLSSRLSERVRQSLERSRDRREHDRAMADPRMRDEHYIARHRQVAQGGPDCTFCG